MEPLQPIKSRKRHGCLISFIAVVAICVLIGALASKFTPAAESSTSSSVGNSEALNAPAKIGAAVSNGKVSIKVNSVKEAESITDNGLVYNPDSGGKFIIVSLTAKNTGKELYSFLVNNFQIKSSDGKQYSPDTILTAGSEYLNSGSINPGLSKTGYIAFEVPKGIKLSALTLEFQEFLSFNEADFSLSQK
jgi:hypothetical protein